jgi:CheY-like chemotaxis protein
MNTIRVLIISGDQDEIQLVSSLLARASNSNVFYHTASTDHFQEALRALVTDAYDIFLVDYHVPNAGITGVDLIQRAYAGGCTAPIILLTKVSDDAIHWAAETAGAADVLHRVKDLCPHPDCPMGRNEDSPQRILVRAIHYAVHHAQQLRNIEKQLNTVQQQLADVYRKLNRG